MNSSRICFSLFMAFACCLAAGGNGAAVTAQKPDTETYHDYLQTGIGLNREGKYDSARIVFENIIHIETFRAMEGGRLLINYANSYFYQEKYVDALHYYFEALRYARKEKDATICIVGEARALANICECYYMMGNQAQAFYYAHSADSIMVHVLKNPFLYLRTQALYVKGCVYIDNNAYEKAEEVMQELLVICDTVYSIDTSIIWYKAYGMEGLSKISLARGDIRQAEELALQGIAIAEQYGDPLVKAKCLIHLSTVFLEQKRYAECLSTAEEAMSLSAEAITFDPLLAYNMAVADLFLGDREKANAYFAIYAGQMTKNSDRNFLETIAGMEMQYEMEKKQWHISALEKVRRMYAGFIALICLSIMFIFLFLRQRMKRLRQQKATAEMRATARGIVEGETNEREQLAIKLQNDIQSLLYVVKQHLGNRRKAAMQIDNVISEIRNLSHLLVSGTLKKFGLRAAIEDCCRRYPNVTFQFFGSDERLPGYVESFLYRCAWELVTHAVQYAEAEHISVQLIRDDARVLFTVFDDGRGYDLATRPEEMGLGGIQHRIDAVGGKIDIVSSPGKGTEITIEIIM
jgi:signal transduction histidine kinase